MAARPVAGAAADTVTQPLLELRGVSKAFGGLTAVRNLSLAVYPGQIFSIIGPNGAGKTTVFNLITGVLPVSSGEVWLSGRPITGLRPHQIAALGVARTFQVTQVFPEKTALENVMVGRHAHVRTGIWQALLRTRAFAAAEAEHRRRALAMLELVGMAAHADAVAGSVSTALQQQLSIAMALASEPRVLLLDEPTGGLMETEVDGMMRLVRRICDAGVAVVLIEHKMRMVMQISDRVAVLNNGEKLCEGTPAEVVADQRVVEAYLGTDDTAESCGA